MYPQDALRLLQKLRALFEKISSSEAEIVLSVLERFDFDVAEIVIRRYSEETATFDRGKLRTLLLEEHSRRSRHVSETTKWRSEKEIEKEARDAALKTLGVDELQRLSDDIRNRFQKLLTIDPMLTDLGRSLIYQELKGKSAKIKEVA